MSDRPDIEGIRERWTDYQCGTSTRDHMLGFANGKLPALLDYVERLEREQTPDAVDFAKMKSLEIRNAELERERDEAHDALRAQLVEAREVYAKLEAENDRLREALKGESDE